MAWFDEKYHLPYKGYLTFDFVSRTVPPSNAKACEDMERLTLEDALESALAFRFWLRTNYITSEQLRKVILKLPRPNDFMTLNQKIEGLFHILDDDDGGGSGGIGGGGEHKALSPANIRLRPVKVPVPP